MKKETKIILRVMIAIICSLVILTGVTYAYSVYLEKQYQEVKKKTDDAFSEMFSGELKDYGNFYID